MSLFPIFLLLGAVVAVIGQDPTTVCFPPIFQMRYYNMITHDKGNVSANFGYELWVEKSEVTGVRMVYDFSKLKTYAVTGKGNDTACDSFKLRQSQIMSRCLPPYAKLVPEVTGILYNMAVQAWDIQTEYDTVFRIVFVAVDKLTFWPIMSQQFGYHGTTDLFIYTNPSASIPDASIFIIPEDCTTGNLNLATIVG